MKTITTVASLINPGAPLMIVGPYGCGKYHATIKAIESLNLVPRIYNWQLHKESFKDFCSKRYGNNVMVIDEVQDINPFNISDLLLLMKNPEVRVVLLGTVHPDWRTYTYSQSYYLRPIPVILSNRCNVLKMIKLVCDDNRNIYYECERIK